MLYFCTEYKIKNNEKINIIARCPLATSAMSAQQKLENYGNKYFNFDFNKWSVELSGGLNQ
jgi:hypothetical protein